MSAALQIKLTIQGNLHKVARSYEESLPIAQTRIVTRKGRQAHKGLRTRVSRALGAPAAKAIRIGAPRRPQLDPMVTVWSKLYRRDKRTGQIIDIVRVFEETRRINPRTSFFTPTDAAARLAGERYRRNVTFQMLSDQCVFLPKKGSRRSGGKLNGVMVWKNNLRLILFYVSSKPLRSRRRFQPFQKSVERLVRNMAELIAKELDREMTKRLRRL